MSDTKILLGGLWKNKSKAGMDYLSGSFGMARLLVFRNTRKDNDKSPDFNVFAVSNEKSEPKPDEPSGEHSF